MIFLNEKVTFYFLFFSPKLVPIFIAQTACELLATKIAYKIIYIKSCYTTDQTFLSTDCKTKFSQLQTIRFLTQVFFLF